MLLYSSFDSVRVDLVLAMAISFSRFDDLTNGKESARSQVGNKPIRHLNLCDFMPVPSRRRKLIAVTLIDMAVIIRILILHRP
jgi:hypothetical protein